MESTTEENKIIIANLKAQSLVEEVKAKVLSRKAQTYAGGDFAIQALIHEETSLELQNLIKYLKTLNE